MKRVLPKFAPHISCHTVNDIEDRIKSMLTKNQFKMFCNDSIFGIFMKKKNYVVQAQLGRCIMSLETKESPISDIVIRVKGTTLHFSLREFAVVTNLNFHSNKDDFVFDEDFPNKIIDHYFDGVIYIQKREIFVAVSGKICWDENDEDALKFANFYFIHAFLLSSVDTIIISCLHFDLMESDRYRDYPWGSVIFKNIKPTRKEISTFQIPKKVVPRGGSHKEDYVDSDDDFQDSPIQHKLSISKNKYQGDSSNSPTKQKLKKQPKGVD
ncbi:hypothetical protein BC332_00853 [Capsicum chinense]|nr:hypothetical protein BC332_00853 [Capsicum chinense]